MSNDNRSDEELFGLTEMEMETYKGTIQDYAINDVVPLVINGSRFLTPVLDEEETVSGEPEPDKDHIQGIITDVEISVTMTAIYMAYDYANNQKTEEQSEESLVKHLHEKYKDHLMAQFVKYGVSSSNSVISKVISELVLEMPYTYVESIDDEEFSDELFLEDRLEAHNNYLETYFSEICQEELSDSDDNEDDGMEDIEIDLDDWMKTKRELREKRRYLFSNSEKRVDFNRGDRRVFTPRLCVICGRPLSSLVLNKNKYITETPHIRFHLGDDVKVDICKNIQSCHTTLRKKGELSE